MKTKWNIENAFDLPNYKESDYRNVIKKVSYGIFDIFGFITYYMAVGFMRLMYNARVHMEKKNNK